MVHAWFLRVAEDFWRLVMVMVFRLITHRFSVMSVLAVRRVDDSAHN
jgi:hypothetical protein